MPTVGGAPGGGYYAFFTTINATTGAAVNADSLPTAIAYKNAVDDHTNFALTVTNITTGLYKITGTIPAGYVGGDSVSVVVSATIGTIAGAKVVDEFLAAPANYYAAVIDSSGRVDVGKILGTASQGAAGYVGLDWGQITNKTTTNALTGTTISSSSAPTAAQIATAVWTDTTAGDFTTATSPGKIIFSQLGGAFTTTSSSVFSTAALANGPTGGSAPTAAQVATAVWQDTTSGDFTVSGSIGKSLFTSGAVPGAAGGLFIAGTNAATTVTTAFTTTFTGNLTGSAGSIAGVSFPAGFSTLTTSTIAAAVWDLATSGHTTSGTFGAALVTASSAGDPWATAVPGSYTSGQAGYVLGHNLDVAVSTRLAASGYTAPPTVVEIDTQLSSTHGAGSWAGGGSSGLDAAGVRAAIGMANPDLDTQLAAIAGGITTITTQTVTPAPTVAEIDTQLSSTHGSESWGGGAAVLAADGLDSVVIEAGINARQALSAMAATLCGRSVNVSAGAPDFKAIGHPTVSRVTGVVTSGDRTNITLHLPT